MQLFVKNRADVAQHAATAMRSVRPGGVLWVSYPKKSSRVPTDLSRRERLWNGIREAGWTGVSMVSIDDVWSAMRFRPESEVGER